MYLRWIKILKLKVHYVLHGLVVARVELNAHEVQVFLDLPGAATHRPDGCPKLELGHLSPLSPLGICWQLAPAIDIAVELHFGLHFGYICQNTPCFSYISSSHDETQQSRP